MAWDTFLDVYSEADELSEGADACIRDDDPTLEEATKNPSPNSETSTLVRPAELPSISAGKQPGSTTPVYSSSSRRDSSTMHEMDDYGS